MKRIHTLCKRIVASIFVGAFVAMPLLTLMPKVLAAGETYTWKDYQTISITGGDADGSHFTMTTDPSTNVFGGTINYKPKNCIFEIIVTLSTPNAATTNVNLAQQIATAPGQPGLCSQDIMKAYNGQQLTIGGTRPSNSSTAETPGQKTVYVTIESAQPAASSPGTATLTVKDSTGKNTVAGPTTVPQSTPAWESDNVPSDQRAVEYDTTFSVDPGTYQLCVDNVLNQCFTFTKVKYQALTLQYGDTIADQTIAVTINITYVDPANATRTLGPVDVTLAKADGSGDTTTVQSDTHTHVPTDAELNSTQYATIQTSLNALFSGIDKGTFNICVPDIKLCKTITKVSGTAASVTFDTNNVDPLTRGNQSAQDVVCPAALKAWGLQYVACPLFSAANTAVNKLEDFVTGMLASDVEGIFGSSTAQGDLQQSDAAKGYYGAWNSFRVLAVSLILIVGLVMVVSEAMGLAIFDAYTIRKVLPRMLIALIFMSISWWLMKFVIQAFNNITVWSTDVVTYPFAAFKDANTNAWSIVGQWSIILAAIAILGPFGILSYAGTIFLALIIAALTLIARRMLLVFAIIGAPLFIASFVAPNTQKLGKFWRDGFLGLLLMGPIFTMLVSLGHVLSRVEGKTDNTFGILPFICLVGPLIAIPVIFAKLGGAAGSLIGMANDRTKGGFDRLKNYRSGEVQRRGQRAKSGQLFGNGLIRGGAAERLNKLTANTALGARGNFGLGAKGRNAYQQQAVILAGAHAKSPEGMSGQFNDDMLRGQTYGSERSMRDNMVKDFDLYQAQDNGDHIQNADGSFSYVGEGAGTHVADTARLERSVAAVKANGGWGAVRQYAAAQQLAMTGTGYDDLRQTIETISRVAGTNSSAAGALAGNINNVTKRAGRHDLAIGVGTFVGSKGLVTQQMAANANGGEGAPTPEDYRKATLNALDNVDMATLARNQNRSVVNVSRALSQGIQAANTSAREAASTGNTAEVERHEREAAHLTQVLTNFQNSGRFGSLTNVKTVHEQVVVPDQQGDNVIETVRARSQPTTSSTVTIRPDGDNYVREETMRGGPSPAPHMQEEAEIYGGGPRPSRRNNDPRSTPGL
ncbi:MAG: hypothetical protein ACQR33_02595 [Candidatus Saccharibacteria bacterium]